ncbi:MAG: hypothetical protein HWE25_07485, partial [Alphaproteobacteria bacterium]|nr:hypothetical protein [Alphaproteobacteria bacterium]
MIKWEVVTGNIPPSSGLTDETVALAKALTLQAASYWSRYIDSDVTLTIELRLDTVEPIFGREVEGSAFSTSREHVFLRREEGQNILEPGATHEIRTGTDPNGGTPDIVITINPDSLDILALDPTPETSGDIIDVVGDTLIDFLSLMIHELGHSLGMTSFPVNEPLATAGRITTFDALSGDAPNGRFFYGTNAQEVLGAPVPLTDGHIGLPIDSVDDPFSVPDTLLSQQFRFDVFRDATFLRFRAFTSSLDLAILQDLGIPMLEATSGADHLFGFEREADTLRGLAGDDTLDGLSGADALWGGDGDDVLLGGGGRDTIGGGAGNDLLVGDSADIILPSRFDPLPADAHENRDLLFGGAGDDIILTGAFTDASGNGTYDDGEAITSDTVANTAWAGSGHDTIVGTDGNETLGGGLGNDRIQAHGGDDVIYGGKTGADGASVNDRIDAGDGDDSVFSGDGDDSIMGGAGADLIFNGAGND